MIYHIKNKTIITLEENIGENFYEAKFSTNKGNDYYQALLCKNVKLSIQ